MSEYPDFVFLRKCLHKVLYCREDEYSRHHYTGEVDALRLCEPVLHHHFFLKYILKVYNVMFYYTENRKLAPEMSGKSIFVMSK